MGQEPKKYHVSDDGKVYRVNEDGSFTELGNAENLPGTGDSGMITQSNTSVEIVSPKRGWFARWGKYAVAIIGFFVGIGLFVVSQNNGSTIIGNGLDSCGLDTSYYLPAATVVEVCVDTVKTEEDCHAYGEEVVETEQPYNYDVEECYKAEPTKR